MRWSLSGSYYSPSSCSITMTSIAPLSVAGLMEFHVFDTDPLILRTYCISGVGERHGWVLLMRCTSVVKLHDHDGGYRYDGSILDDTAQHVVCSCLRIEFCCVMLGISISTTVVAVGLFKGLGRYR